MLHSTFHKRTARRFLAGVAAGAVLAGTGIAYAGHADATPGQCVQAGGWGGFCDSLPLTRDGIYRHCENALFVTNCFLVRPVPTDIDPRGWLPA